MKKCLYIVALCTSSSNSAYKFMHLFVYSKQWIVVLTYQLKIINFTLNTFFFIPVFNYVNAISIMFITSWIENKIWKTVVVFILYGCH